MWVEFITLVITVTFFHEVGHLIPCLRRVRGVFAGISRRKGPVVGFVVHPLRKIDILFPQVFVPIVLLLMLHNNIPLWFIGILGNVGGGVYDFTLIKKIKTLNERTVEEMIEKIRKEIIGVFVRIR